MTKIIDDIFDIIDQLGFNDVILLGHSAFGIDWLNERWMDGNTPTYQEFADMWEAGYRRRKERGEKPKEEWAYISGYLICHITITMVIERETMCMSGVITYIVIHKFFLYLQHTNC